MLIKVFGKWVNTDNICALDEPWDPEAQSTTVYTTNYNFTIIGKATDEVAEEINKQIKLTKENK